MFCSVSVHYWESDEWFMSELINFSCLPQTIIWSKIFIIFLCGFILFGMSEKGRNSWRFFCVFIVVEGSNFEVYLDYTSCSWLRRPQHSELKSQYHWHTRWIDLVCVAASIRHVLSTKFQAFGIDASIQSVNGNSWDSCSISFFFRETQLGGDSPIWWWKFFRNYVASICSCCVFNCFLRFVTEQITWGNKISSDPFTRSCLKVYYKSCFSTCYFNLFEDLKLIEKDSSSSLLFFISYNWDQALVV